MIDLKEFIKREEKQKDGRKTIIKLEQGKSYCINETICLQTETLIDGNGAVIQNNADIGLMISASETELKNLKIFGGGISIQIDNKGKSIENIAIENCELKNYMLSGLVLGTGESGGTTSRVCVKDCVISTDPMKKDDGTDNVIALDILITAGLSDKKNIENVLVTGVEIDNCKISGHSICNIMSVPGLSLNPDFTPIFSNCAIENVQVTNSELTGSDDTAFAAQANYINNEACYCRNFTMYGNEIEFGLTGLSASAGSPMTGKVENIFFKKIKIANNRLTGRKNVGETRTAIGIGAGGIDYKPAICNKCGVEDVEIIGNTISECERGITVSAGHSMIDADAPSELRKNYVKRVVIKNNELRDVQNCFIFYAAWIEGRRFDWNWGLHHTTQTWLAPVQNHHEKTVTASENYIENLLCEGNYCDGFSYLLHAASVMARGHGLVNGNEIIKDFVFKENKYKNGEEHIRVCDTILEDWVTDGGNNILEQKNILI